MICTLSSAHCRIDRRLQSLLYPYRAHRACSNSMEWLRYIIIIIIIIIIIKSGRAKAAQQSDDPNYVAKTIRWRKSINGLMQSSLHMYLHLLLAYSPVNCSGSPQGLKVDWANPFSLFHRTDQLPIFCILLRVLRENYTIDKVHNVTVPGRLSIQWVRPGRHCGVR